MKRTSSGVWRPKLIGPIAFAAVLSSAVPASAHHSFAMFDKDKPLELQGTVKTWEFTNPHSWLVLEVMQGDSAVEYSIEGSSVNTLVRRGWGPKTFQPGEKVTVVISPLKNGARGGAFVKATLADGTVMSESPSPN